jgi:site-specific DNA recombinase
MYVHGVEQQLIERAHFGDLSGMHFAGLVRLSFEYANPALSDLGYTTGRDIKGRGEQGKRVWLPDGRTGQGLRHRS